MQEKSILLPSKFVIDYSGMKNLSISLIAISIFLSACGGSAPQEENNDKANDEPRYHDYVTNDFKISVPDDWETLNNFDSSYPDGLRVAFKDNVKSTDFVANVSVFEEESEKSTTNEDLSQNKLKDNSETLLDYELISQEEITLDKSTTYLNIFEGKNSADGETFRYMQTYIAKGTSAWIITGTYLSTEDEFVVERMETMLKSFNLK